MIRRLSAKLTYANAMSSVAVFLALGGSAYAVTALPAASVGTEQLKPRAVTAGKIADGSIDTPRLAVGAVTLNRLSGGVQRRLLQPGPRGEAGPVGPAGPTGATGPGASRMRFSQPASDDPAPEVVLDAPGFRMRATCVRQGDGVGVILRVAPDETVTISETVTVDHGADLAVGGETDFTGNLAITVPGGVETVLGGPSAETGYARAIATLVVPSARRTISAQAIVVADATAGRCSVDGAAVAAG